MVEENPIHSPTEAMIMAIITKDFANTAHLDANDQFSKADLCIAAYVISCINQDDHVNEPFKVELQKLCDFINDWGIGMPTACGYQEVNLNGSEGTILYQLFCLSDLCIAHRVRHRMGHAWLAYSLRHFTSAPIWEHNGTFYFKSCPHATVVAWGTKNGSSNLTFNDIVSQWRTEVRDRHLQHTRHGMRERDTLWRQLYNRWRTQRNAANARRQSAANVQRGGRGRGGRVVRQRGRRPTSRYSPY